ncbi:MAG: hypothetical protein AAF478_01820 [Pseudomonadota bacterium]
MTMTVTVRDGGTPLSEHSSTAVIEITGNYLLSASRGYLCVSRTTTICRN